MASNKLKVILEATDKVTPVLQNVGNRLSKLSQLGDKVTSSFRNVSSSIASANTPLDKATRSTEKAVTQADRLAKSYLNATHNVYLLNRGMRDIATSYIGGMGVQAALDLSDQIIGAQNRLNYANAQQATKQGIPQAQIVDPITGGYTEDIFKKTTEDMNKMYASAQKVRMGYTDMVANVAKSMTLASSAFKDNTDNAIRFQEVLAEAYAIGGASAAEVSSSMYQMMQALGSGILQGDELRSVREGAPLAYQEIEKFAQGVYDTNASLKDMASQGKITSDIVVQAMLEAGVGIDDAFQRTTMTFGQAFTQIKNTLTVGVMPVLKQMNQLLNSDFGRTMLDELQKGIIAVSYGLQILMNVTLKVTEVIAANWEWLKYIFYGVMIAISFMFMSMIGQAIVAVKDFIGVMLFGGGLITGTLSYIAIIGGILIAIFTLLGNTGFDSTMKLVMAVLTLAGALLVIGYIIDFVELMYIGCILAMIAIVYLFLGVIIGAGMQIKATFEKAFAGAKAAAWDFLASCFEMVKNLEPIINAVAEAFGMHGFTVSGAITEYHGRAEALRSSAESINPSDAYKKGFDIGEGLKGKVTDVIGDTLSNLKGKFNLGGVAGTLGLTGLPDINDPSNNLNVGEFGGGGLQNTLDDISGNSGKTAGNTKKMADSMELTEEDLKYLRDLADMEWKKEFTTANIVVDMNNVNNISGDTDLDGIVTRLTNKLYEELETVANGVYV